MYAFVNYNFDCDVFDIIIIYNAYYDITDETV